MKEKPLVRQLLTGKTIDAFTYRPLEISHLKIPNKEEPQKEQLSEILDGNKRLH